MVSNISVHGKRTLDYNEAHIPDNTKAFKPNVQRITTKSRTIKVRDNAQNSETFAQSKRIINTVHGSQLLNACKANDAKAALKALSKITSFDGLAINDINNTNALSYASANRMSEVISRIQDKIRWCYDLAKNNNDLNTIYAMRNQYDIDNILENPNESEEQSQEIRNMVLGSQLLEACKEGTVESVHAILSEITSIEAMTIKDREGKTILCYASEGVINIILQKIKSFGFDLRGLAYLLRSD